MKDFDTISKRRHTTHPNKTHMWSFACQTAPQTNYPHRNQSLRRCSAPTLNKHPALLPPVEITLFLYRRSIETSRQRELNINTSRSSHAFPTLRPKSIQTNHTYINNPLHHHLSSLPFRPRRIIDLILHMGNLHPPIVPLLPPPPPPSLVPMISSIDISRPTS